MDQSDLKAPTWQLSERARKLTSSAIREILKVTERPEVISFAGGLPSPATFPVEDMRRRVRTHPARPARRRAAVQRDRRLSCRCASGSRRATR